MFSEKTNELIKAAINSELENAISNYGNKYNSEHEAYAVLKEEFDECHDQQILIKNNLFKLWDNIKLNNVYQVKLAAENIRKYAENMAKESVQVAAVCDKLLQS